MNLKKEALPDLALHVEAYRKAADAVGYRTEFILDEQLACFLREQGHGVYPYESVGKYLSKQVGFFRGSRFSTRRIWYWSILREKDCTTKDCVHDPIDDGARGFCGGNWDSVRPYDKPIPLPVLMTVRDLELAWADKTHPLRFFVSDFTNVKRDPDPFLAVTAGVGRKLFVIERWDEPAFRG